jgi:Tfp pilus assembly pilus retraction ATPase PilT
MIISQRLVPTDSGVRVAIFDIMVNTPQLKTLIKSSNMSMFRALQSQGDIAGMKTFDNQLTQLIRKRSINQRTAIEFAIDKNRFTGHV